MCQTILNSVHLDILCVQNHIQRPEYKILDTLILHISLLLNISLSLPESIRKQTQLNVFSSLRIDLTSFKTIQGTVKTICTSGKYFEMHDNYWSLTDNP